MSICVSGRKCLFGDIENGLMRLNEYGKIVTTEWLRSAEVRLEIECGEFVVMPNHFHGIVRIVGAYGNTPFVGHGREYGKTERVHGHTGRAYCHTERAYCHTERAYCHTPLRSPSRNIGAMVRGFKGAVSRRINESRNTPGALVWQRNYYEHVIRDDADYNRIAEYVVNNPKRWLEDSLHPLFSPTVKM